MSRYKSYHNYDLEPATRIVGLSPNQQQIYSSWPEIWQQLQNCPVVLVDFYQGVLESDFLEHCPATARKIATSEFFRPAEEIRQMVYPDVTDDAVFGYWTRLQLADYIDPPRLADLRQQLRQSASQAEPVIVYGPGAALLLSDAQSPHTQSKDTQSRDTQGKAELDATLVYCDMARWEIQQRQRQGLLSNLGVDNRGASAKLQYKHSYFVDWRVLDRHKQASWHLWDWVVDCNRREPLALQQQPQMLSASAFFIGLEQIAEQPFRLVPFFDPGVWGGQWMKEVCGLERYRRNTAVTAEPPNYAWCFDCVPEENSLQMQIGDHRLEFPSSNLVFAQARKLLGDPVQARFGKEFPIRFDFLDTMEGQNLSFQVHPKTEYIQAQFGMHYTQDESYYILDAEEGAVVYLGLQDTVEAQAMLHDLEVAQRDPERPFPTSKHVNKIPAGKHDHFLIPAGTTHCSGSGSMVLEISATPYIFTFKLWDWERLDLDGKPRPINLAHGAKNIEWGRTSSQVQRELVNHFEPLATEQLCGAQQAERTGLHQREFIETRRYWFTGPTRHDTGGLGNGSVHVLNLVEGRAAVIKSPDNAFPPFEVHYAETFVIPAAVGKYIIEPVDCQDLQGGQKLAVLKAYVRYAASSC